MKIIKRVFVSIVISMILLGTVLKPVSVSADDDTSTDDTNTSIFGKSWFYNAGEDPAESGTVVYFDGEVADSTIIASEIYDQYLWYSELNAGKDVTGSKMYHLLDDKGSSHGITGGTTTTFIDRFCLGIVSASEEVVESGDYYRRNSVSPYIWFETEKKDFLWWEYGDGKIKNGIERKKDVRRIQPFTPEINEAFITLYTVMSATRGRTISYMNFIGGYIPESMRSNLSGYAKTDVVKEIAANIDGDNRDAFAAKYEEMIESLKGLVEEDYGVDTVTFSYTDMGKRAATSCEAIINANTRGKIYFVENAEVTYDEGFWGKKDYTYVGLGERNVSDSDKVWVASVISSIPEVKTEIADLLNNLYNKYTGTLAQASGANVLVASESEAGTIEKSLAEFVKSAAGQLSGLLGNQGITLDTVVYGRVVTAGRQFATPINYYTFELQRKNAYGIIGAVIFSLLRVMLFMGVIIYAMIYLVRASFSLDPRTWAKIKGDAAYLLGAIALLFFMPNLIDGAMWLRDQFLGLLSSSFGDGIHSITGQALEDAASGKFIGAAEYLGMVLLGIYFAFSYISAACSMMIMFGMFPVFLLVGLADKKIIGAWWRYMIGIIMIPMIDACLLFVPHIANSKSSMPMLAQIILCMAIIPTRGVVRQMLGFGHSAGAELVGIGAMMAAGRAIGGVARTAKNAVTGAVTGIGGAIADSRASKAYGELAKEDNRLMETAQTTQNEERTKVDVGVRQNEESSRDEVEVNNSLGKAEFGVRDEKSDMDYYQGLASTEAVDLGQPRQSMAFSASAGAGAGGFAFSAERTARQAVLAKAATLSNFDTQFKGALSNEQMAQMYKKRAAVGAARTVLKTAGTIAGGAYVGATGAAAGMMFGPTGMMMGAGMGASLGGEAGGALGDAIVTGFASSASWYDEKLSRREQAKAAAKEQAEFLAKDNNLGYVMYTGDADADIRALDNPDYVAAQKTRWAACSTPERQLEELRYQNSIINRASRNPFTGRGVLDEKQEKALLNSAFVNAYRTNLDAYRKEHTDAVVDFSNDPVSYGYYSQSNMKTWQDSMFSTDQQQAVRNLDDHTNSNRMGMLLLSAMRNDGEKSTAYQHAYNSAKRSVTYNSSFIPKKYSAFDSDASDAVEAGRVLSRFKEPDIDTFNDNSSSGGRPDDGGGAGNTYVDTGHKDPNDSNDKLDSKTSELHDNHDGGDGDKPHSIV